MADFEVHLRIDAPKMYGKNAKVFLNNEDISHRVAAVHIDWRCDDINRATIELLCDSISVDGVTLVAPEPRIVYSTTFSKAST